MKVSLSIRKEGKLEILTSYPSMEEYLDFEHYDVLAVGHTQSFDRKRYRVIDIQCTAEEVELSAVWI